MIRGADAVRAAIRNRSFRRVVVLSSLLVALLASAAALAQGWRGDGRAAGVVLDAEGRPVAGARVTLTPFEESRSGPDPVTTNRRGRWSVSGLAGGLWRISIEAEGHITSQGRIAVPASGSTRPMRVRLRPLDEVSPLATEGNPRTVVGWIEKGDTLMSQGRHAEAREEYERALRALPPAERPRVLQSIARAHWLEGNHEASLARLREAVALAPADAMLRTLLEEAGRSAGREQETTRFLAEVDEGLAGAPAEEASPPPTFTLPDRPVLEPEPHRNGSYRTAFEESGEISSLETFVERTAIDAARIREEDPDAGGLRLGDETFEVYVPDGYDPGTPHGLFVWISPTPYGGTGRDETRAVLDRLRIISIGANHSGNRRPKWDRYALALEAARHARKLYAIDERRVWVGGYSGGGRIASGLAMLYPDVFLGGFYVYGCDHYLDMPVTDRPGARWPAMFRRPPKESLRELKRNGRFVLLTGELDFNRPQTRATYESLVDEGFRHVTYLEIPDASHYTGVSAEWLERGFAALDGLSPE